ncbi:Ferredoxin [Desulfosporosinus sp. I2]|uniref:EFR1 family ferrodoxin n=1 Tax=Desulfosporosinus sp. I2 TaxID=1617025 RepID=UPI0005EDE66D|nr:EFR1 family ferrodoxin [Desulfosporosinus sp. I2]KJR44942.1 Ferredoxin [Desulfosporosinus sp. I2]
MQIHKNEKKVQLVFFSGTGGVKRIANAFYQELLNRDLAVIQNNLDSSEIARNNIPTDEELISTDLIILIYPVHAFDAPAPIYDWVEKTCFEKNRIAVISVSGGGEGWPNTGCRNHLCKILEEKGCCVVYDRMMCMPCNWVFKINDHAAMWQLRVIPIKVNQILDDLLAYRIRRANLKMGFWRAIITKLEKKEAHKFAKDLKIDVSCTGCGWCVGHCPVNNLEMRDKRPYFKDHCVMCFRCVYACPSKAIKSKSLQVLKNGYSLSDLEKRMEGVELEPVEKCCKGVLWAPMRKYLLDKDT